MAKPQLDVGAAGVAADAKVGPGPAAPACVNCGAVLRGAFCHACGQSADLKKRHALRLLAEIVASLLNYDNRLVRTLTLLFLRPGVLAKDMIDGRIARHTPPFQTFLVSVSLFILVSSFAIQYTPELPQPPPPVAEAPGAPAGPTTSSELSVTDLELIRQNLMSSWGLTEYQADEFIKRLQTPEGQTALFMDIISKFGQLLIYILPIMSLILNIMFSKRRDLFIHDHFLVSCYICSLILITNCVAVISPFPVDMILGAFIFVWNAMNIHHVMRVGYGASRTGAIVRTAVLWLGTNMVLLSLLVGVFILSLFQV
jgi:hypothetical protein